MGIKKSNRVKVYEKYGGRCAYCGKELTFQQMQIDHIRPKRDWVEALVEGVDIDSFDNLNPSCRRCNHYKRSMSLYVFRQHLKSLHERIAKDYIVKVGLDYGVVSIKPFDGKFYFEKYVEEE